jgi:hypothetical protein
METQDRENQMLVFLLPGAGLPDFSSYNIPKTGENIPKLPLSYQMAIKYTNLFLSKVLRNLTKLGFLV